MVDSLDAAVTAGVVGARGDFADAQESVDRGRELGAEVWAFVREQCRGTAPDGDEAVDENVDLRPVLLLFFVGPLGLELIDI